MDFILALEHPCMSHAHMLLPPVTGDSCPPENHGHSLLASSNLLALADSSMNLETRSGNWQVPTSAVERLLELSSRLDLFSGEITPVQGWHRLRSRTSRLLPMKRGLQSMRADSCRLCFCSGDAATTRTAHDPPHTRVQMFRVSTSEFGPFRLHCLR